MDVLVAKDEASGGNVVDTPVAPGAAATLPEKLLPPQLQQLLVSSSAPALAVVDGSAVAPIRADANASPTIENCGSAERAVASSRVI